MGPSTGYDPYRSEAQFTVTLSVTGPVDLEVFTKAGSVRIRRGDDGAVVIHGVLRARPSWFWGNPEEDLKWLAANPPVERNGNAIRVGDGPDRWSLRRISFLADIAVPRETRLRALGDSADMRVRGIDGPVECETDSGEIEIADIGSNVRAASDSGAISICGVNGSVEASADSGAIEALEIAGRVEVQTDSGEIHVSQKVPAPVQAQADSGAIAVKLAENGGYSVRIRTDGGCITTPDMTIEDESDREIEFELRGGGAKVNLETDSGSIDIS